MPPSGPARTRAYWILALIVALALAMRVASAGRMLPELREPDAFEVYEMQRVQQDPALVKGVNFDERYPWLLAWTLAGLPAAHPPATVSATDAEELHLAAAARPFLRVRLAVVLLATLQVLLVFFLARRFLPEPWALVACFLVATSLLQLLFATQARPHGAHAGLALLALIAALQLVERFSLARLALAALASCAAIATFQMGFSTLPPLFVACLFAQGQSLKGRVLCAIIAPLAAILLALLWYTNKPYIDASGIHLASAAGGGHTLFFQGMDFLGALRAARLLFEHDPLLALSAGAGLALLLARARGAWKCADASRRRALLVACAFALPYTLVLTIQGEVYERFLVPLLPFAALLGAGFLAWVWSWRPVRAPVAVAFLALPAVSALQYVRLALVPDSFEQAADWIRHNVDHEAHIALLPDNSLPLLYSREAVQEQMQDRAARNIPWVTYQATIPALPPGTPTWDVRCVPITVTPPSAGPNEGLMRNWLSEERVDYLVVEYSQRMWRKPIIPSLERAASDMGELVFRSSGSPPGLVDVGTMEFQGIHDFAWRQIRQGALGPQLRIWKLNRR
ncbi:MAG: hypothetical protein IPJ19_19985 [Planctomycetes bacterium]|nr:hypothetical protein [Planctomycetota bacterium]